MGDSETFYRPDQWNADGYFEQIDIHAINMPLINGPWGKFAYLRLPSTETILARAKRRHDQIVRTASKYLNKVVKETRFCLTLPAWIAHGARFHSAIVCLRHPSAVVQSLCRRNWITRGLGYRLWLTHIRRLLSHVGDIPVWFVQYENILDESTFATEFEPATRFFGLAMTDERLAQIYRKNVKPSWNHHSNFDAGCPESVDRLWQQLLARHAGQFRHHQSGHLSAGPESDRGTRP